MSPTGSRATLVVGVASALLLVVISASFVSKLERVERVVPIPPSGEARWNWLLAAERFLVRMGLPATSTQNLEDLPPPDHVLVMADEDRIVTEMRAVQLLDWVAEGGLLLIGPHLEAGVPTIATHDDPLLQRIDVSVLEWESEQDGPARNAVSVRPDGEADSLEVRFAAAHGLFDETTEGLDARTLIWRDHGRGRIGVLQDLRFLRNDEIGDLDHAEMLWRLVRSAGEREGVLLVSDWGRESIWALLWRHGWLPLVAAATFAAVAVWRRASRSGPVVPDPPRGTRSLMEHVDAAGRFLWRHGGEDTLIEGARAPVLRRVGLRRPDFARLDRGRQVGVLALGTRLPPEVIERAVFTICPHNREAFTRVIHTLETLRRDS